MATGEDCPIIEHRISLPKATRWLALVVLTLLLSVSASCTTESSAYSDYVEDQVNGIHRAVDPMLDSNNDENILEQLDDVFVVASSAYDGLNSSAPPPQFQTSHRILLGALTKYKDGSALSKEGFTDGKREKVVQGAKLLEQANQDMNSWLDEYEKARPSGITTWLRDLL